MQPRMNARTVVVAWLSLLFFNCATTAKLAPLSPLAQSIPVPMQQEQMAAATRAAVTQAVNALDMTDLAARQARVQVSGAFPPSDHELLDFVGMVAEGALAERGVRIEPKAVPHAVLLQNSVPLAQPDFIASLTLDTSGVDVTMVPQLTGPIVLMGIGGGLMTLGATTAVIGLFAFSGALAAIGGGLGLLGLPLLIIGAIWAGSAPSHYVADARVKLALTVQPVTSALRPQRRTGEGTNTVRYEPNKAGGLKARLPGGW